MSFINNFPVLVFFRGPDSPSGKHEDMNLRLCGNRAEVKISKLEVSQV